MEIRKLEIDFDSNILKINGKLVEDKPVIVTLPSGDINFPYRKLFNPDKAIGHKEECDVIEVFFKKSISNKP